MSTVTITREITDKQFRKLIGLAGDARNCEFGLHDGVVTYSIWHDNHVEAISIYADGTTYTQTRGLDADGWTDEEEQ